MRQLTEEQEKNNPKKQHPVKDAKKKIDVIVEEVKRPPFVVKPVKNPDIFSKNQEIIETSEKKDIPAPNQNTKKQMSKTEIKEPNQTKSATIGGDNEDKNINKKSENTMKKTNKNFDFDENSNKTSQNGTKEKNNGFYSPRERNHSPKDINQILEEETQRYWSPNHAKLKSNEYFLAKRKIQLKKEQGIKEDEEETDFLSKIVVPAIEVSEEVKKQEKKKDEEERKLANEFLILTQMKMNEKNRQYKPYVKEKDAEEKKNAALKDEEKRNAIQKEKVNENSSSNSTNLNQIKKASDEYFLTKKQIIPTKIPTSSNSKGSLIFFIKIIELKNIKTIFTIKSLHQDKIK